MTIAPPTVHVLGRHEGHARSVTHTLRAVTRTATRPHLIGDADTARHALWTWARTLDIDVDAIAWIPGHDATPGPGHTCAHVIAQALDLPLIDAAHRNTVGPSAHQTLRRSATQHARSITANPLTPRRLALVDNTIATGNTITGCTRSLTAHGHHIDSWIAVTDARHGN